MNRAVVSYITILFAVVTVTFAGDDPTTIVSRMQKRYDKIEDATIVFQQHIVFGVMNNEQEFSGTLVLKKGNQYRIELEDQTIVTDGKSVWSYSKSNNQVLIDKFHDDPKSLSPDRLLVKVPDEYQTTILGKETIGKHETLIP